ITFWLAASESTTIRLQSAANPVHPPTCPQASFLEDSLFLNDQAIWINFTCQDNSLAELIPLAAPASRS
ncbi:hypothetical protein AMECASPLE_014317, partial [Ameca splendens]